MRTPAALTAWAVLEDTGEGTLVDWNSTEWWGAGVLTTAPFVE